MGRLLVVLLSIVWLSPVWCQNEKQKTSIAIAYHSARVESFTSLQINGELYKSISFESALGVGFRTTVLQGRLFPQFSVGVGYNLLRNSSEKLSLSPMINARISSYRLSPLTRLNYTEVMPGYSFMWGNRLRLVQSTFFGRGWENLQNEGNTISFWSFSVNLGVGYVF
jgi:hypothetical protein